MYGCKLIPLIAMPALLTAACGVTPGPAYDPSQDDPANHLPERIVIIQDDKIVSPDAAQNITEAPSSPALEPGTDPEYQAWLKAKKAGSDEYQEFLEYQDWLKFKKLNETSKVAQ